MQPCLRIKEKNFGPKTEQDMQENTINPEETFHKPKSHYLNAAPATSRCPNCEAICSRHQSRKEPRTIWDIGLKSPVLLFVYTASYFCERCATNPQRETKGYFESVLPFAPPKGHYTYRVIEKATQSIDRDQMAFYNVNQRLVEDFHVKPDTSTIWRWWREYDFSPISKQDYESDVCRHFSRLLCIDELYEGKWLIVTATDPNTDRTLKQWRIENRKGELDEKKMEAMLWELKEKGFEPEVVMTDGSELYPKAVKHVWPKAKHALCQFHWTRHVVDDVRKAVKRYSQALPQPKKRKRGRPKKRGRPRKDKEKRAAIAEVRNAQYVLVAREENRSEEQQEQVERVCQKHPVLETLRQFIDDYYKMMEPTIRPSTARKRHQSMLENQVYRNCGYLKPPLKRLEKKENLNQLWVHLYYQNGETTNNHVERINRRWRRRQKSHYRLRSPVSIDRMLSKERRKKGRIRKPNPLQKRFGRPPAEEEEQEDENDIVPKA